MTPKISDDVAELIGIIVGDGCISVTKNYKELAILGDMEEEKDYYDNWIVPLMNKNIVLPLGQNELIPKFYTKMGVYGIITFNKAIVDFFLNLGLKYGSKTNRGLPKCIKESGISLQKRFLKGLTDTDGTISFGKVYPSKSDLHSQSRIKIASTSKKLIYDCAEICQKLGFNFYFKKPYKGKRDKNLMYGFVIYKKKDVEKWIEEIGFRSPKHLTKIQIWQKFNHCPPRTKLDERLHLVASQSAKLKTQA